MPVKTKDYPIYTYDEPAVYRDFSGGLNTDPSNDHLLDNELRECVNMTYLSGALVKRKGAKKLCDVTCEDDLTIVQGVFLFTYRITYIIIAADGKLYKGIFNDDATIELSYLPIKRTNLNPGLIYDEQDAFAGLEEKNAKEVEYKFNHEGYIQTYYKDKVTQANYVKNERGSYFDVSGGAINIGDVFTETKYLYEKKFLCIKDFEKTNEYPSELKNWELENGDGLTHNYYQENTLSVLDASEMSSLNVGDYPSYGLRQFSLSDLRQWTTDDYVFYNGKFYHCIAPHYNRYNTIEDENFFVEISNIGLTNYEENSYMIFQNYRKVEAATIENKMFIATGTRIVEIYLQNNEIMARPVLPYRCNYTEIAKIGYNYLSPYPELAVASQKNTVTTSISAIKTVKTAGGRYLLQPVMNVQIGDSIDNYYFRWEKNINGVWYVVIPFQSQKTSIASQNGSISIGKANYSQLEVDDANHYYYRCTFAKSFELETTIVQAWEYGKGYNKGDYISNGAHVYKCLLSHADNSMEYNAQQFDIYAYPIRYESNGETTVDTDRVQVWEEVFDLEILPYVYNTTNQSGEAEQVLSTIYDFKINKADGEYFGSATSVLFNDELTINDKFILIHSCTKVIADGQKLLFYDDRYNSGQWFKTIINNPAYITDRGCLSFKTNKNEALIKVIPFQGNLIAFANSANVGGSIHLVKGNGDDYDDQSGYYSPYQRRTINSSISSSNPDSIQVCDNIIVFKYFNRVYYINASDLNNDTVKVTPCNDRILNNEGDVKIPWDDDDCISEVTNTYYALIWKDKFTIDNNGDLIKQRPGTRVKMYYKMSVEYPDHSFGNPWLMDESDVFNARFIIYVNGKPLFLYHNILCSFNEEYYKDIEEVYETKIRFKAVDLNYETFLKLIENCTVEFHRDQYNDVDITLIIRNEAGHVVLNSKSKRYSTNDLGIFKIGTKFNKDKKVRIGSTIKDAKMFITVNKFPLMLADAIIYAKTEGSFALSGMSYSYTSIDVPDTNPSDIYEKIIRPEEDIKNE